MINFHNEKVLWDEIFQMAEVLQCPSSDEKDMFYKEVFDSLQPHHQCAILLQLVDKQSDVLSKCKLMTLVLQRHPETIEQHGISLIESLIASEDFTNTDSSVNCYRKYLVCDILPQVLRVPSVTINNVEIVQWLDKSIQFYVSYIAITLQSVDGKQDKGASRRASVVSRSVSIEGLSDKDSFIRDPWKKLVQLVRLAGHHLGWTTLGMFDKKSRECQWQMMQTLVSKADGLEHDARMAILFESFYLSLLLCFDCILCYVSRIGIQSTSGGTVSESLVLLEGFRVDGGSQLSEPKSKKAKTDAPEMPVVHTDPSITACKELTENLQVAVKCWEMLNCSVTFNKDFQSLLSRWRSDRWHWLNCFQVDYALYQGELPEVMRWLLRLRETEKQTTVNMRRWLQLAYAHYSTNDYTKCCETVMSLIKHIDPSAEPPSAGQFRRLSGGEKGRHLYIMPCGAHQVLPCCIHLLIACLKEKAYKAGAGDDAALGHMLVLLQYDWPRYEQIFTDVRNRIKRRGSFKYKLFFNYVINIDILEEFAYLRSAEGGKLSLDILPVNHATTTVSRTVTRGVNKGVKEDFRVALEKQVVRCNEDAVALIRRFLDEEQSVLQQCLL